MKPVRPIIIKSVFGFVLFFLGLSHSARAQETIPGNSSLVSEYPQVSWVNNWPSDESRDHKKSFKDQLNSLFFGIKQPELLNPVAVLVSGPDEFLVLDQGNRTLFHVLDEVGDIPQSILKSEYEFSSLIGICSGPQNSILFTDSKAGKVYGLVPGKKRLLVFNDTLKLEQPTGIAYSPLREEIWVLETKAHRLAVLNENGELLRRIGIRGNGPGEFNFPTHLWIDKKGFIFITDAMNFRIQVLNPEGLVVSVFGEAGDGTGYMARPKGIATDSFGNIYVVDALFHVVQVFDVKGTFLYKFGSQGHENGRFWMPSGIYIDDQNFIYIADTYNSRIQVFHLVQNEGK
ncbi:MAG: 6-bladed beta-propeller [Bacteroidales bacterium]|nr:6-bladed beta-propeller [Bacteroidales bacterium]